MVVSIESRASRMVRGGQVVGGLILPVPVSELLERSEGFQDGGIAVADAVHGAGVRHGELLSRKGLAMPTTKLVSLTRL